MRKLDYMHYRSCDNNYLYILHHIDDCIPLAYFLLERKWVNWPTR